MVFVGSIHISVVCSGLLVAFCLEHMKTHTKHTVLHMKAYFRACSPQKWCILTAAALEHVEVHAAFCVHSEQECRQAFVMCTVAVSAVLLTSMRCRSKITVKHTKNTAKCTAMHLHICSRSGLDMV